MHSPKFPHLLPDISNCLNKESLKATWREKIGAQLRKQVFLDLLEYQDFKKKIDTDIENIVAEVNKGQYRPRDVQRYLVEKSRGLCRQMTTVHPRDLLVLQALSTSLYTDLRKKQPTSKAFFEPGEHKFNRDRILYRENEYGSIASWKKFQREILEFSKTRKWLVVADIANFYDFINFKHLRNIVASYCKVSENVLDLLLYILNEITWTPDYMPRSESGLPQIEAEAPRVLANAMLYELDIVASSHAEGDYVRFMDDIDVGVSSMADAKRAVRDIDLTLQTRQLRLNSSKTKILNSEAGEVDDHFCVRENKFLDYISAKIESKPKEIKPFRKGIMKSYEMWKKGNKGSPSRFERGNGSKIFKRMVAISSRVGFYFPNSDLEKLIWKEPGLRDYALGALARNAETEATTSRLLKRFVNGDFVDHYSVAKFSGYLVHARFQYSELTKKEIQDFVQWCLKDGSPVHLHAAFLVASKFFDPEAIVEMTDQTKNSWKNNFWLARVVAGNYPRMLSDRLSLARFVQIVQRSSNSECESVLNFHFDLTSSIEVVRKQFAYLKSDNPTFPYKIIHSKALQILSVKNNSEATRHQHVLKSKHLALTEDHQYRIWLA
jgi:Reverse transcriptase (RNA-dependent DNA polymerase)